VVIKEDNMPPLVDESNLSFCDLTTRHSRDTRRYEKCQKVSKIMYQLIVLLDVANTTQAFPIMAEPLVRVVQVPNSTGTYRELRN